MPEPVPAPPPSVFQLRVVLRGISPLIWRRLLVRSDTTFARLHDVLQVAFGWDDVHLHCFRVHGRELDAIDGPHVRLADVGLRPTERFVYVYDFVDLGRHDVRVEHVLDVRPGPTYPCCTERPAAGRPTRRLRRPLGLLGTGSALPHLCCRGPGGRHRDRESLKASPDWATTVRSSPSWARG